MLSSNGSLLLPGEKHFHSYELGTLGTKAATVCPTVLATVSVNRTLNDLLKSNLETNPPQRGAAEEASQVPSSRGLHAASSCQRTRLLPRKMFLCPPGEAQGDQATPAQHCMMFTLAKGWEAGVEARVEPDKEPRWARLCTWREPAARKQR